MTSSAIQPADTRDQRQGPKTRRGKGSAREEGDHGRRWSGERWVAVVVVGLVALAVVAIVLFGFYFLATESPVGSDGPVSNPNAGTVSALATAGITAISTTAAAFFGIRAVGNQGAKSEETTLAALNIAAGFRGSDSRGTTEPPEATSPPASVTSRSSP